MWYSTLNLGNLGILSNGAKWSNLCRLGIHDGKNVHMNILGEGVLRLRGDITSGGLLSQRDMR